MSEINYQCFWENDYDLENDELLKAIMLEEHIPKNVNLCGSIDEFVRRLEAQAKIIESRINPKVIKWFTLKQQIKFIKKYQKGEFANDLQRTIGV